MIAVEGYLEKFQKGFGFLRQIENNFDALTGDTYVSPQLLKKHRIEEGSFLKGQAEPAEGKNKNPVLNKLESVNNFPIDKLHKIVSFKDSVTINPEDQFDLSLKDTDVIGRCLNLLSPVGRGQRGLIVSPPKAGKTTILQHYAQAITKNHSGTDIYVLLVDERPEEVTDFKRSVPSAFVLSSSSDESVESHLRITRLVMNSAIKSMEAGNDVVVLIDSLTRMGRAYNKKTNSNGRTLSGGLSANALELPRRFFGAARNLENSGSLTILATILVDTGSRMDEIIFQEFKGTGNMDLILSRKCAEQRVWPAININESGTRKEHLLMTKSELQKSMKIRQVIGSMNEVEAMRYFMQMIRAKKI
ncbi:MAG: transcription termination factor Rho [Calditrichaeota bacterium]|nr:MAG: transcription termination factor Rho [Calditrichota bacterium]MBL1207625.1 transcription termination factor Rho [Calditrichota bacterium]NOG47458.1 transcription termination factor Rho [Calditrichota bacterium]